MKIESQKKLLIIAALFLVALISFLGLGRHFSNPDTFKASLKTLDEKKLNVMSLSAATTAASVAITVIPGDTATPIAEKLADFSGYFILIFCVIYAEKFLLAVGGALAFKIMIPIGCLILIIGLLFPDIKDTCNGLAKKIIILGGFIFFLVPTSVWLSNTVEASYRASIENTVKEATNSANEVTEVADDEDSSAWDKFINTVSGGIEGLMDKFKSVMNRMADAIAVYLVTTFLIPLLVVAFFVWVIKMIFGVNFKIPAIKGSNILKKVKNEKN